MAEEPEKSIIQGSIPDQKHNSVEAIVKSGVDVGGPTETTCNNNNADSIETKDGERDKSLEYAEELMSRGSKAAKNHDYSEATDCYSRALEIRVAHYGELAPECVNAYYKYGCALLYKAQEEADPLAATLEKDSVSQQNSCTDGSTRTSKNGESSAASVSNNAEQGGSSNNSDDVQDNAVEGLDKEEVEEESDVKDNADSDEDESDLDLAWKMLDVARAIVEKQSEYTVENVDILSALAEVALEREDVETSLNDYLKALSILERLVEHDSRLIAELNFRICLCLEIGSKPEEAIPYCQKAISVCKSRVQRFMNEAKNLSRPAEIPSASELDQSVLLASNMSQLGNCVAENEEEIQILTGLAGELENKLEDLQQLVSNPKSILADILGVMSAKAKETSKSAASKAMSSSQIGKANSDGGIDSPTISTAHTSGTPGVTHLGVVGRGVKRVLMNSSTAESNPTKKPSINSSINCGDASAS